MTPKCQYTLLHQLFLHTYASYSCSGHWCTSVPSQSLASAPFTEILDVLSHLWHAEANINFFLKAAEMWTGLRAMLAEWAFTGSTFYPQSWHLGLTWINFMIVDSFRIILLVYSTNFQIVHCLFPSFFPLLSVLPASKNVWIQWSWSVKTLKNYFLLRNNQSPIKQLLGITVNSYHIDGMWQVIRECRLVLTGQRVFDVPRKKREGS